MTAVPFSEGGPYTCRACGKRCLFYGGPGLPIAIFQHMNPEDDDDHEAMPVERPDWNGWDGRGGRRGEE